MLNVLLSLSTGCKLERPYTVRRCCFGIYEIEKRKAGTLVIFVHYVRPSFVSVLPWPTRSIFGSADQELCVVGMSTAEDNTTRETGTSDMFADFDSTWGSPIDFDDLSGAYGDEGKEAVFHSFMSRFDVLRLHVMAASVLIVVLPLQGCTAKEVTFTPSLFGEPVKCAEAQCLCFVLPASLTCTSNIVDDLSPSSATPFVNFVGQSPLWFAGYGMWSHPTTGYSVRTSFHLRRCPWLPSK